jgi:diguanylate cyclase (GGDEF)-like protein/PAS domain S-box-containing protein
MKGETHQNGVPGDIPLLRADELPRSRRAEPGEKSSPTEIQRLLHELQVRQIELETQNEELRDSRAGLETLLVRLRDLYDLAPAGYLSLLRNGTIAQANRCSAQLLGLECAELVGKPLSQFVSATDRLTFNTFLEHAFGSASNQSCELTLVQRRQSTRTVHLDATCTPDGRECRVVLMDVTERRWAEESLRASGEQFRNISDAAVDGIAVIDGSGTVIHWSLAAERIFGHPRSEMVGRTIHSQLMPEQFRGQYGKGWREFAQTGRGPMIGNVHQLRALRRDGTEFSIEVSVAALRVRGQWGAVGIFRDVTQRKHADEARRLALVRDVTERTKHHQESQTLRSAIEQGPTSVVITDAQANIVYVNPRFTQRTGYSTEEVIGKNPRALKSGIHPDDFYHEMWSTLSAGQVWQGEICNRTKAGQLYWESASISPVRNEDGQVTHYLAVTEDITATKRENVLRELFHAIDRCILRGTPTNQILALICAKMTILFDDALIWIGMKEFDGSIRVHTHSSAHADYLKDVNVRWDDAPEGDGPAGRAIQSGELQCTQVNDPCFAPWYSKAKQYGFQTAIAIPLVLRGAVDGVLSIYSPCPKLPNGEACGELVNVASRISVTLDQALDQEQLRLQGVALSAAANGVFITDRDCRIKWVNDGFTRQSGYSAAEAVGQTPHLLSSGDQKGPFCDDLWHTIRGGEVWKGNVEKRHKSGSLYMVNQSITPLRDDHGQITHFVAIHEDITARVQAEARIEYDAHHDSLTGLFNRTVFQSNLPMAMAHAKRAGHMVALFFLDLDHFKFINDTLGHASGDLLLRTVADRLRSALRDADVVARLGGDEFAIIQTDLTHINGCITLAQKLLRHLSQPVEMDGHQLHVTASIGITVYPADDSDPAQLVKNADLAMYRAKHEGRNNYQFYSAEMNADVQTRLTMERELRRALECNELVLYYQPQMDQPAHRLVGVEALLRWQHPRRGLLAPAEFITVAEDCGLIVPLGEWVLRQACVQNQAWQAAGLPPVRVAVNVATIQFQRGNLVATITQILQETGLAPQYLAIELTESGLMTNLVSAAETLKRLHDFGIQIAIDDFGTGYSSLNYLKRFAVDKLKIDRSFVHDLTQDPDDASIVKAIIQLGHSLGLLVIAEGVETEEELRYLSELGCDEIQGYYFSRPVPAEAIVQFMKPCLG